MTDMPPTALSGTNQIDPELLKILACPLTRSALKQEGDALTGEMTGPAGATPIENGAVEGDVLKWHAKVTSPMPITLEFEGKQDGDNLSGSVKLGAFGNSTFSGVAA